MGSGHVKGSVHLKEGGGFADMTGHLVTGVEDLDFSCQEGEVSFQ